jgi:hypothetical protein
MRRLPLALLIATLAGPTTQAAEIPAVCKALRALGEEARTANAVVRIAAVSGADGALTCPANAASPATGAFCEAAAAASGAGPAGRLPWLLYDCVDTMAAAPQVITADGRAGRRPTMKVTRLAARLAHGVRVDMSFAPATAPGWSEAGRYDVVVWAPK